MRRIVKYLKPYIWQILLVLALVFVQAMTDLKLPDYMSKIVNEGVLLGDNGVILSTGLEMLAIALVGAVCTLPLVFWPLGWHQAMHAICATPFLKR